MPCVTADEYEECALYLALLLKLSHAEALEIRKQQRVWGDRYLGLD